MEPKRNAPKLVAIICVVALLVAIYCSCFAETAGGTPLIHYPYFGNSIKDSSSDTTHATTSAVSPEAYQVVPGEPDTPPELPAPPTVRTVVSETTSTGDDYTWLGDDRIRLHQEDDMEPSAKSLLSLADCHYWDDEEVMDYFEEVEPSLQYTCPYEIHKCVSSMTYTREELTVTWDIYLFSYDGIIGTWIVNDSGKDIVFYGDAYLYSIDNYNVHLGKYFRTEFDTSVTLKHLCVSPESFTDGFMVVTYYEEIAKIS